MASFKKINTKVFNRAAPELTEENIYWKKYTVCIHKIVKIKKMIEDFY